MTEAVMTRVNENQRNVEANGRVWAVMRMPNVDLWTIKADRGPVPNFLEGSYTSPQAAATRIADYVATLNKPTDTVKKKD